MHTSYDSQHDNAGSEHRSPEFTFHFDPDKIRLSNTPYGVLVDLPDGRLDGTPGGPALPIIVFEAALPPGTAIRDIKISVSECHPLAGELHVAPLQPAAIGAHLCNDLGRLRDDGLVLPWPKPQYVPPDPGLYREAVALGTQAATVLHLDRAGPQPVATLALRPLFIDEQGALQLRRAITVTLLLGEQQPDASEAAEQRASFNSRAQAERWVELVRSRVINPNLVIDFGAIFGNVLAHADYLIITDNQRWDAATIRPAGPAGGDLVAEFERLAAAKRATGLSARVVTIGEIVNGNYGTFTGSCRRDLQEVLREFIKFAHANWGTAWLLLGGDVEIVPVRSVVGYVGGFSPQATNPPEPGTSFWAGSYLKIHANVTADTPLLRTADGHRIPYDATGMSNTTRLGWIFTDASYTVRSTVPTAYIRVNGPAAQVNTELFWLTNDNTLPTDLYYADVAGYPTRAAKGSVAVFKDIDGLGGFTRLCGGHDWDNTGNSLYGQWSGAGDLDGVHYAADISVGRAPASNAAEARIFVDKVLRYSSANSYLSNAWLSKLLMVSSNWGGRTDCWPGPPLADYRYVKRPADNHAVLQLATPVLAPTFKLISVVTEADQRELPYRADASASVRGWRFALSATNASPSVLTIPMPWGATITIPLPSRWIVAYGAAAEMAPLRFILDESAADGSMLDQEALRTQLAADVPHWSSVRRLYEDELDLAAPGPAPLEHLTAARLHDRLDEGQHIVSLSGHGYWGGCCGLDPSMATALHNGGHTFIAYADSCLTNQFDVSDAISESLVQSEHGGAVAYVGNTRFSWIGVGDDFQRNFFKGLPGTRALGLLNDRRLAMLNAGTGFWPVYNRWSIFSLNLIGDPEMRIWTHRPLSLCLQLKDHIRLGELLSLQVLLEERPAPGALVTVRQGQFMRQARADRMGYVHIDLEGASAAELSVTAYHPDAALMTAAISLQSTEWIEGLVLGIRATAGDTASAVVQTGDGERSLTVAADATDLIALLAQSTAHKRAIRMHVVDGERIDIAEMLTARPASMEADAHAVDAAAETGARFMRIPA